MSRYYQIINGNRYNASLIRNGEFRVKNVGDGRISLQDAQELWQIAMDGGRVTEVEEDTIKYLLETLNWTAPAREWIEEQMAKEVEVIKSYYRVIDGLRYDRKILKEADERIKGVGDGRISREDAELLLPLFGDFGDVTIVEERTLKYLMENYKWTDTARSWFLERVDRISKQSDVTAQIIAIMKFEFEFERLRLDYFRDEALQQMLDYENKVSMAEALRQAINNILNNTEPNSFGAMVPKYTSKSTKEFIEGGRLVLLPGNINSEPSLNSFPSPSRGESLAANWIFGLELFDLTDDIFWVVVARDGGQGPYNYVGGPNFDEEWPPHPEMDTYFTIVVKSCDIPYPGITVDIQAPNGKYIVGKSDEQGQVRVSGPAGVYSIFASDGWSSQSKSYEWDGKGTDKEKAIVLDC